MNNSLRYAVTVALAGAAVGSAHATDISTYTSNAANNVNVFVSGSTALDNTMTNAAIQQAAGQQGLCIPGTADIYLIGTSQKLIYCQANTTANVGSGKFLALFKESNVGSANGVQPLINAAKGGTAGTTFLNPAVATDANCGTPVTTAATGDFSQYVTHPGCGTGAGNLAATPTGGFADVEAAMLLTAGGQAISATDTTNNLSATPTVDQVWGVAVTKALYYALQSAEGLTCPSTYTSYGVTGAPSGGPAYVGKDSASCAPSLSRQQVASIITRQIGNGTALSITNGVDDTIYICRRDFGSGTEASFEAYFVGQRCGKPALSVPGEEGFAVWAAGSSGGVRTCLQAFQNGGITLTGFYDTTASFEPSAGSYAVGFTNTEITQANMTGAGDAFRLIAVDGVLPQIANVQDGTWPYFSTGNAYTIKAGKPGATSPTSLPGLAFAALTKLIGHPTWTADSNTNYSKNPWGIAGDMSPAGLYASTNAPALPANHTSAVSNPTNAYTKSSTGAINNCDQPVFDFNDLTATTPEAIVLGTSNVNN
jgi:hypothetical protein